MSSSGLLPKKQASDWLTHLVSVFTKYHLNSCLDLDLRKNCLYLVPENTFYILTKKIIMPRAYLDLFAVGDCKNK